MKRILITGVSGTEKSTLVTELAVRGYKAVDLNSDAWSQWIPYAPHPDVPETDEPEEEWVWQEDCVRHLLRNEAVATLFLSGCASNMTRFYDQFDAVVLLSAPLDVMTERLAMRTTNNFGKRPEELARILNHTKTVEPLLRNGAPHEIDTSLPLEEVVEEVLQLV